MKTNSNDLDESGQLKLAALGAVEIRALDRCGSDDEADRVRRICLWLAQTDARMGHKSMWEGILLPYFIVFS